MSYIYHILVMLYLSYGDLGMIIAVVYIIINLF